MKLLTIASGIVLGVVAFAWVLTMILTSVILTSSLDDTWIKPGEQVLVCKGKEFTVNPKQSDIYAFISPDGVPEIADDNRSTVEVFNSTVKDSEKYDLTSFHAAGSDTVTVYFSSDSSSTLEVYYYETVTYTTTSRRRSYSAENDKNENAPVPMKSGGRSSSRSRSRSRSSSRSSSSTKTVKVRRVVTTMSGSDFVLGPQLLPGDYEYGISLTGTLNSKFNISTTVTRKYYECNETIDLYAGNKTEFNSEKAKEYCVVLEAPYDSPITDPEASKIDLDLYCAQRFNNVDIAVICVFTVLLVIAIFFFCLVIYIDKTHGDVGIEMS